MMVYLMHFDKKHRRVQHYIGYAKEGNFEARMKAHRKGRGSSLLRHLNKIGIDYLVVKIWIEKDGNFERKLKNLKNARLICPVCNPDYKGKYNE